jgi:Ca2+-transporting ATPase
LCVKEILAQARIPQIEACWGEAALIGGSVPVDKNAAVLLDQDIPLGDRKNSAFMSTLVTYGRGKGLIAATGINTQIGLIAEMLQSYEDEPTPLQMKRDPLAIGSGLSVWPSAE